MAFTPKDLPALLAHDFDAVVDVRSPAEFAEDHLPNAINLPALSNEERARVGTIYKQESPFKARKIGAALVARNVAAHLDGPLATHGGGWRPLIYCWRGGQRSGSVATILREVGWRAETLEGGYRSYRKLVHGLLHDDPWTQPILLLEGNTGTAKTEILKALRGFGVQTLDLEGLAKHRGSLLGATSQQQPSQKAFESALATRIAMFDAGKPLVVEAESSKIGDILIPPRLWRAMCAAPALRVGATVEARAAYLVRAYEDLWQDRSKLGAALSRLVPHQGRVRVAHWLELASENAVEQLARELILEHYDPRYASSSRRHARQVLRTVSVGGLSESDVEDATRQIAEIVKQFEGLATQ